MHLYRYTTKYTLHKTWVRPRMALYGPPTYCGADCFWPAWYFQIRRPEYTDRFFI